MEVIARRVASGQAIKPPRRNRHHAADSRRDPVDSVMTVKEDNSSAKRKLEKGVGIVKAVASEGVNMVGSQQVGLYHHPTSMS
jgi:hypothetical protein